MASGYRTEKLSIGGMTCTNCQNIIEKNLRKLPGVQNVRVSYAEGMASICYDPTAVSTSDFASTLDCLGYRLLERDAKASGTARTFGLLAIIAALYLLLEQTGLLNFLVPTQLAQSGMSYGMLFIIGLMTSVHCVAMCGGINLSQSMHNGTSQGEVSTLDPALRYNLGRVASYTAIGFIVGALGSVVTFSNTMQGVLKLIAGALMVIMGLNMLAVFPWLRRFSPRLPSALSEKIGRRKAQSASPLIVGLLNGLMPCGPLQAMQLYALSTGSAVSGALSMLVFSLGTVPLMFGLSVLSTVLSKKHTAKMMTAGAVLVAVLGLSMLSQGVSLAGLVPVLAAPDGATASSQPDGSANPVVDGVQLVSSTLSAGRYPAITVKSGTPVKWTISASSGSINGCNNRMIIPEYALEYAFVPGENVIEFIPTKTGTFQYSCWMGMIRGTITVVAPGEMPTEQSNAVAAVESAVFPIPDLNAIAPVPVDYAIPTDSLAVAENLDTYQRITLNLTETGFSPAVAVIQAGVNTEWIINSALADDEKFVLTVPFYQAQAELNSGENAIYFSPTENFDFSDADGSIFGYVKVVPDIKSFDADVIKQEVANYQAAVWPAELYASSAPACH